MPVLKLSAEAFRHEYGIQCHRYFPQAALDTPFGASYCVVEPGGATSPHQHHEGETFYVAAGQGRMAIANEPDRDVAAGDVIYLPAHAVHTLTNTADAPLAFFSVWWDDHTPASAALPARRQVIVAPPTPNGDLHLGHLSGPYLAADAHARHLRSRGVVASYMTGADEYQSYVAKQALAQNTTPEAVASGFGDGIAGTLAGFDADLARFTTPGRDPGYAPFVQAFFAALVGSGAIVQREVETLWCDGCEFNLYEAWVSGGCPHCGVGTSGNGCEGCYRPNDCADLVDPCCARCGAAAARRTDTRWYFPLEPHRAFLSAWWDQTALAPHLRLLAANLAAGELPEVGVSHRADWGIPIADGHVIYEWLEMAAGFLHAAAAIDPVGGWQAAFAQPDADVVQFFGMDNAFFFLTLLPAALHAFDPLIRGPRALATNEFYRLDGLKFSTSRRHAIWGDEARRHAEPDVWRFLLAWDRPEHAQTSFGLPEAAALVRSELLGSWEAWLGELSGRMAGRSTPSVGAYGGAGGTGDDIAAFSGRVQGYMRELAEAYGADAFSLRRAVRVLSTLVADARTFGSAQAFMAGSPGLSGRYDAAQAAELAAARALAVGCWPVMPAFAGRLLAALGEPLGADGTPRWDATANALPAGRALGDLAAAAGFGPAAEGLATMAAGRTPIGAG